MRYEARELDESPGVGRSDMVKREADQADQA